MQAALQLFGDDNEPLQYRERLDPFDGECPRCGTSVLAVDVDGRDVTVDLTEVLEAFRCPLCAQVEARGHERSGCERCGMTGWIGEELPLRGVAVDPRGLGRLFSRADQRFDGRNRADGEAVHVLHSCA